MANEKQTNPYEGAIPVTQNPYAGSVAVTEIPLDPYASAEVLEEKTPIKQNLYRTIIGAGRDLLSGTLDFYGFSQKFKPAEISKAIVKARKEKDAGGLNVLNNIVNQKNIYEVAAKTIPTIKEPEFKMDVGFPEVRVGKKEVPLGLKDVPVGSLARDIIGFGGAYAGLGRGITTTGAKNIPEMIKQGAKVIGLGSAAEQLAFSPDEQRLSNVIQDIAPNVITEFLQADPDDNEALARFKMGVEGAGLAIPVEALFRFSGKLRANKQIEKTKPIEVSEEQKIIPTEPEKIDFKTEAVTEGPYAGAEVSVPPATGKMLPPSLRNPEPKIKRVNSLLYNRIPMNDEVAEEMAAALGYDLKTLPLIYRAKNAKVGPDGKVVSSADDRLAQDLDELGFASRVGKVGASDFGETTFGGQDALEILRQNPVLPEFEQTYINYITKNKSIEETLDLLKRNNIDPRGMTDEQLSKTLKQINENESYTSSVIDEIELSNIAKQQTDDLYQQMMAREKSLSITKEDLAQIPPRETIDVVPANYVEKDFGFSKRPPRVAPNIGDDKFAGNINLNKINEPTEVKNIIKEIAKDNDSFVEARRGVVKFGSKGENLEALSRELGLSDSTLLKRKIGQAFNSEEAYAARLLFDEALKDAYDLANIAKGVNASQVDLIKFENAMARVASVQEQIAGITAEAGRALRSFRETVGPASTKNPKLRDKLIQEFIAQKGGDDVIKDIAKKMTMLDDPAQLAKFARDQYKPKFMDYVQEFWINALLSSPSTHIVNTLSNTLVAGLTPIEYITAAAIGKIRGGEDIVSLGEAGARLLGTLYGTIDGVRAAGKAIIDGEAIDPLTKLELQRQETIPGVIGKAVRLPGTALVAEDAFFKSIGYRQELWGRAVRQAQKEKKGIKRAYELMRNPEELAPNIHLDAIDAGRYQTFTNPLGTAGRAYQKIIGKYPALRFITPFVRTPVNIVSYAFERTPAGMLTNKYKEAIKKGGQEADIARAKLAVGAAIGSSVLYYANAGLITGRGPADSRERSVLMETGWQPYSLKIGDKYYGYNRFEPVGILFGITADMSDIGKYVDRQLSKEENIEIGKLMSMLAASISENITNKTFLTGLSDVVEMLNDPDRYGEATIQRFVSSFIPTFSYYERKADDPVIRDVQSFSDAFANRFPEIVGEIGLPTSKDLPAKRNVFGEIRTFTPTYAPLGGRYSPVRVSTKTDDVVFNEFVKLGYTPPMPKRNIGSVDLTPQQYEDLLAMQQLLQTKQTLAALITSPGYKKSLKSTKEEEISEIFRRNQEAARDLLKVKYPEIIIKEARSSVEELTE
jgi:hypothetical protein